MTGNKFHYRGGRYRQVSLYYLDQRCSATARQKSIFKASCESFEKCKTHKCWWHHNDKRNDGDMNNIVWRLPWCLQFDHYFAPKRVGVRGPQGEFLPQPQYHIFTKMTPKEWLNTKISKVLSKKSGSKRKNDTQQEYVWHLNTQPEGVPEVKKGV